MDLQRALANEHPSEFNVQLASSFNHLSNHLSRLDRHEEGLLAIQESVDLYRAAAEDQLEVSSPGLAASLYNLSTRLSKHDLHEEGLVAIQEASKIYQKLATEDSTTYGRKHKLSLAKISDCLKDLGQEEATAEATDTAGIQEVPHTHQALGKTVSLPSKPTVVRDSYPLMIC